MISIHPSCPSCLLRCAECCALSDANYAHLCPAQLLCTMLQLLQSTVVLTDASKTGTPLVQEKLGMVPALVLKVDPCVQCPRTWNMLHLLLAVTWRDGSLLDIPHVRLRG